MIRPDINKSYIDVTCITMVQKKQRPVLRFSVFINAFILAYVSSIGVVDSFTFTAKGYQKMQQPTILCATEKQQETKTPCPLLPPVENVEECELSN